MEKDISERLIDSKTEAVLVSVYTKNDDEREKAVSLEELERLLETAGGSLFTTVVQQLPSVNPSTCIGKGKLEELGNLCRNYSISLVIFDCDLSPAQIKNIEDGIEDCYNDNDAEPPRVIDRSMLILDIFALHATSGEGKLQVELAQLKYTIPRLIGRGAEMSRLGGGIGTRGPGESKLETDRRHVQRRINALQEQIDELGKNRMIQRSKRDRSGLKKIAIVGYTNAGKSTLLNTLTDAGILADDKLFATLDPTPRNLKLPSGREVLLTDTVGFIRNLPHHLISAFRSTLEEVKYSDAILVVLDASDPEAESQLEVTEKLLFELGASYVPRIYALNKCDCGINLCLETLPCSLSGPVVPISAKNGDGLGELISEFEKIALSGKSLVKLIIPVAEQGILSKLYNLVTVENCEYYDDYVEVIAVADEKALGQLKKYIKNK
ncbi:MAG: GTPase HflX [Clostridia bacterium]|nr:GTPase HflX [Clostridia bacterium]